MRPPCEVVVKRVLPTIRAMLVRDLVKRHGLSQVQVAEKLGITQPAVSQYLSSARGTSRVEEILKKDDLASSIHKLSDAVARGEASRSQILEKYCDLCRSMGRKEILCILHVESAPYLKEEGCKFCLG